MRTRPTTTCGRYSRWALLGLCFLWAEQAPLALYKSGDYWPQSPDGTTSVPICFQSTGEYTATEEARLRALVQEALAATWGRYTLIFFWGWMADRIGRRKAFIGTALNFSVATGIMALTPDKDWVFLTVFRFFVGFGVSGLFAVDTTLVQEYVPASKRGWVGGLVTSCLPLGLTMGALLGRFLAPYIGWRGLFAVGLLPALLTLLIRAWVPESPRWLLQQAAIAFWLLGFETCGRTFEDIDASLSMPAMAAMSEGRSVSQP